MGISDFVGDATRKPGRPRTRARRHLTAFEIALDDAARRANSGDWDGASGATLVGLYAFCHRLLYTVLPEELAAVPKFNAAAKRAKAFVHDHFADDFGAAAAFIKWSWEREKRKNQWCRDNGVEARRLGWLLQFSPSLLTDWRVDAARKRGAVR